MNSLPSSVNYAEVLPSLPENATRYSVALQPTNGATFAPSSQIMFQYPNRGYLIPDSVFLRYKITWASGAVAMTANSILATPFFTPFQRLETQLGSVIVDSINNYHQVCNILTNTTMDWAQKYGNQFNYGYGTATSPATVEEMDGRSIAIGASVTQSIFLAGPLPCLLTNVADKLVPLFAMPTISMILTLDALSNMVDSVSNFATTNPFVLSNVELCFDFIELGSEVDAMVRGMGDKIYLKSQSFANSGISVPIGANGSQSYIFNQRYASVKGAIVTFSGGVNKLFDAIDITNGTGSYSLNVSGVQYPQKPYSVLNNKASIMMELKKVLGSIYDKTNNMAINSVEFNQVEGVATTVTAPGKFYLGFNLQKLHSNALLTGISTNNSNITVNIEQTTATTTTRQLNLIIAYDALIEIDIVNKQASVKS